MNNINTEELRLKYLSEMGITSWVLREPFERRDLLLESVVNSKMNEVINQSEVKSQTIDSDLNVENMKKPNIELVSQECSSANDEKEVKRSNNSTQVNQTKLDSELSKSDLKETKYNQFLNVVDWSSDSLLEHKNIYEHNVLTEKNILIVCRHKVDQPANSFVNKQLPSRFMQDYLRTLVEFGLQNNLRLNIQLAHLAESGIGKSSIKVEDYYQAKQPNYTLVLGDETVTNLINNSMDVKNSRCRINKLYFNMSAIVSYHPFDLISNPRLKSLAYEDLQLLINTLRQVDD